MKNDYTQDTGVYRDIGVPNFGLQIGRAIGIDDTVMCPNFRLFITKDGILTLQKEIIGADKSVTWKTIPTVYER